MYCISSFSVNRLNNAEFVGFFINLVNLIEKCEATKLGLDANLVTEFVAKKQQLVDQVRISAASELTAKLNAANEKRIRMFKMVNYTLRKTEVSDSAAIVALADKVQTLILKVYTMAILRLPQQELTTVLSGLIYDLQHKFTEDDLDDLGVATELTNLESANQEFIAAYSERAAQRAEGISALTQILRQEMVDLYMSIGFTVQYFANSSLEANAQKAAACQEFIAVLNAMLSDAKYRYNQRMNALHAAEGENAGGGSGNAGGSDNTEGGANAGASGNDSPAGGTTGNDGASGGNSPAGGTTGNDGASGGTTGNDTPAGGNTDGNDTPASGGSDVDRENGTLNGGTVEF